MGTTPSDYPIALTVKHVAEIMGISRSKAYEMMHNPKFPVIREGRRLIIPRDAFLRWMDPNYTCGNNIPNVSSKHVEKIAEKDRVVEICTQALVEAVDIGSITVKELVSWALSAHFGR